MKTKTNETTKRTNQASLINITGSTINITNSKFLSPENCNVIIETPLKNLNKWELKRLYHNNEGVRESAEKEYNTHALKDFKNEIYSIVSEVAKAIQDDVINDKKNFNLSKVAPFGDDKQNAISVVASAIWAAYEVYTKGKQKEIIGYFIENLNDVFDIENTTVTNDYKIKEHIYKIVG